MAWNGCRLLLSWQFEVYLHWDPNLQQSNHTEEKEIVREADLAQTAGALLSFTSQHQDTVFVYGIDVDVQCCVDVEPNLTQPVQTLALYNFQYKVLNKIHHRMTTQNQLVIMTVINASLTMQPTLQHKCRLTSFQNISFILFVHHNAIV